VRYQPALHADSLEGALASNTCDPQRRTGFGTAPSIGCRGDSTEASIPADLKAVIKRKHDGVGAQRDFDVGGGSSCGRHGALVAGKAEASVDSEKWHQQPTR
jgi:hypothetical protein